ncbi:MAG: 4Fe-4S dicluster domain-containing protein [Actinomycetota bacterium]
MEYYYIADEDLPDFVNRLAKDTKVVAPVKKENLFVFSPIDDFGQVELDSIPTILSPKKYFTPQHQNLGRFKTADMALKETAAETEKLVILGIHTCDIEGIECLDAALNENPPDPYFNKIKENIIIIGYECLKACDEFATCRTMDTHIPKAGYDIMLTKSGEKYIVQSISEKASALIKRYNDLFKKQADSAKVRDELSNIRREKEKDFPYRLNANYEEFTSIFRGLSDSMVWDDVGKRCVSCGNCTNVCPTCYCFDIYDYTDLDNVQGTRNRRWDSCQLNEFAMVAGGENFRESSKARQRHRYYRKFDYPVRKYNKFFCTGCGRCTRTCVADISLIETVNSLIKEYKNDR